MMTVPMDNSVAPSSRELAERLYKKNIELETNLRKLAKSRVPSDPNTWFQIRENYESIIIEDHDFSEKHDIELALWQLHYRRIEEFRSLLNAAKSSGSVSTQGGRTPPKPDSIKKIRSGFKTFLSESTGFYHDLIVKIKAKFGLPLGFFSDGPESQTIATKDEKRSAEMKKGLMSCHRSLIYLGDLARYKGSYGEGDSISREFAAASSYYTQAASLCPSSGNPHHQLAILASYSGDDIVSIYRYFRSLAVDIPFSTARDNLIIAFEKNRQSFSLLPSNAKAVVAKPLVTRTNGRGRGRGDARFLSKDSKPEATLVREREASIPEILKSFSTRFVRVNGILFTRTSLETFGEVFSSVKSDLLDLLSSGPEDELNFGQDAVENGLLTVRLIAILIFTVHNVKRESDGQSYAEILQRTVLLQNAYAAAFEYTGHIIKRCEQLRDAVSSFLLPAILVFIEWLACHQDIAVGPSSDAEEKQAGVRSFFWIQFLSLMNKLISSGLVAVNMEDETFFSDIGRYDEEETGNRHALWEDFELRGFVPLVPAQQILDFSRKHSHGSDGSEKDKLARVQRLLAAGRALMNVVRVDQKAMYFDSRLKKFVIGNEPPMNDYVSTGLSDAVTLNITKHVSPVESSVSLGTAQQTQVYADAEDDEEEIVFKPFVGEKYPSTTAFTSMPAAHATIQPAQISAHATAQPTQISAQGTIPPTQISAQESIRPTQISVQETKKFPSKGECTNYSTQFSAPGAPLSYFQLDAAAANYSLQPLQNVNLNTSKWLMEQAALLSNELKTHNGNGVLANHMQLEGSRSMQSAAFAPLLSSFSQPPLQNMNLNTSKWLMEQVALSNGLTNLNINGNGILANHGAQGGISAMPNTTSFAYSPMISSSIDPISRSVGYAKNTEVFVPSSLDSMMPSRMISESVTLPNISRKTPVSRPVRHLGPPPGFSNIPSKSESSVNGQSLQIDDYRWLDGYQAPSTKTSGMENLVNNTAHTDNTTKFSGAMNFPFPGKQISNVQTQVVNDKWKDFRLFEHDKPKSELQKLAIIPEQNQAQPLWPPGYFV